MEINLGNLNMDIGSQRVDNRAPLCALTTIPLMTTELVKASDFSVVSYILFIIFFIFFVTGKSRVRGKAGVAD